MSRAFRYNLILSLVALGTALAAAAGWRFARASAPVSGPIVLVSIDSLRADHLPAYGYRNGKTPALDALAADGIVFERAYAHAPLTLPAHVSLLSGRLPVETGIRDNISAPVPDTLRLIQSMLADRGYATGGIVSSFALRKATGLSAGFTFFDDELVPPSPDGPAHTAAAEAAVGPVVVRRDGAESEKRAERWLSGAGTSRAFLFLHLDEPHAPYAPPAPFAHFGPYDGEVAYADELVGRLVAYLKKQQLYDESTIIVVGDHGESLGAHGESEHGLLVFDETLRVPLIIKRAGAEGKGTRVGELVQHVDIVPTILDLVNAPTPGGLNGRSLRPLLTGGTLGARIAYGESQLPESQYGWHGARTVTDGRFRYVSGPVPALFDLEQDPESRVDVSAAHPDEVARLARALEGFERLQPAGDSPTLAQLAPLERLAALTLGFIGPRAFAGRVMNEPVDAPADAGEVVAGYNQAMLAYSEGRWYAAMDQLRGLTRRHPDAADVWASLARVADRAQRYDVAADAWQHAVMETADVQSATDWRLNLAWTLFRARRLDDARQQAALAIESGPGPSPRALELLARVAIAQRDAAGARLQAAHVQELEAASPIPAFVEGRLLADRGRWDEALVQFDKAAEQAKATVVSDLEFWRGETLMKLDRPSEAEDAYAAELRRVPDHLRAFTALATLYHAEMRADDLAALMDRYTRTNRTPEAFESAARLWTTFGRRDAADLLRTEAQRLLDGAPAAQLTQQD